jgi:predicted nucleic acid-binding protein
MGRLKDWVKSGSRVALDTALFIYHLEANPHYLEDTTELFAGIEDGLWKGITSVITLMEIAVAPIRQDRANVAEQYEALLANFPNLTIADVSRPIARQAARVRAKFNLRPPDAIQAATALVHRADVLITNDRQFARLQPSLTILLLDELSRAR